MTRVESQMAEGLRFFVGYGEVAGYFGGLTYGLRSLGHDVLFVDLAGHAFDYEAHGSGSRVIDAITRMLHRVLGTPIGGRSPRRMVWLALAELLRVPILFIALRRCDVFVISGTRASTHGRELRLLQMLGKRVVLVFNGTDARAPYLSSSTFPPDRPFEPRDVVRRTKRLHRRLRRMERHADEVVCHATCAHLFSRPLVKSMMIGIPIPPATPVGTRPERTDRVRVLHAPSNPAVKGTALIRAAVENARRRFDLEYVEVSGRPHTELLEMLASVDVVVDQAFSDTPMAGLAAEAAAFAIPSVVGGYELHEVTENEMDEATRPPTVPCTPTEIGARLEMLLDDESLRADIGARAKIFVEGRWTPTAVAERYVCLATGTWTERQDPSAITYVHGAGLPEDRGRELVAAVLEHGGPTALCVDDKPELLAALVSFAHGVSR